MAIVREGCLQCPGCGEYNIEADEKAFPDGVDYETPGADQSPTKCVPCYVHDGDGDNYGPEDCGCTDCIAALARTRRDQWREHQALTLLSEEVHDGYKVLSKIRAWRLVDEGDFKEKTFTIIDSTPLRYDTGSFTGASSCTVYEGCDDTTRALITVPGLDRARLFCARTALTGEPSFEAMETEDEEAWAGPIAALIVAETLNGRRPSTSRCLRTFYAGNPWHVQDDHDHTVVTRLNFADSVASVIEFAAVQAAVDPLTVGIKKWHRRRPKPTWTDLHKSPA